MDTAITWESIKNAVDCCTKCRLCEGRCNTVVGIGKADADVMFIGEGPGREEDEQGIPFVGRAGILLDKIIGCIGLNRDNVYIANIVKCRPPDNRVPTEDEAMACIPYLRAQFMLVRPKIIVCLGATAARYIIGENVRITRDRGMWIEKCGVWFLLTYHPAALLRDESKKRPVWEDMKSLRDKIDELGIRIEGN